MRLNNYMRETIYKKVACDAVAKDLEKLAAKQSKLAKKLWEKVYPKAERDAAAAMAAGWIRIDKCLQFNLNGMYIRIDSLEGLPVKHSSDCRRLGDIACEKLGAEFLDLEAQRKALHEKRDAIYYKMKALLESVTTFKQLEQTWPEGKKFYEPFRPKTEKASVPAVLNDELNALLGIK